MAAHDHASPPWCLRLMSELEAADERARLLAGTLTLRQLNWTPAPGVWSVGQCLEHLRVANDVYLEAISSSLAGRRPAAVQDITPGWFGRWFIRNYIDASAQTRRARAPKEITPVAQVGPSILAQFLSSNQQAREVVHLAGSYDVNRIRFRNPFVPLVRFTVGTGLEILLRHERRHLLQAEGIRASREFPTPPSPSPVPVLRFASSDAAGRHHPSRGA